MNIKYNKYILCEDSESLKNRKAFCHSTYKYIFIRFKLYPLHHEAFLGVFRCVFFFFFEGALFTYTVNNYFGGIKVLLFEGVQNGLPKICHFGMQIIFS